MGNGTFVDPEPVPVRRIVDWPLIIQTLVFLGSMLGIAMYAERRVTLLEVNIAHIAERQSKLEAQSSQVSEAVRSNQEVIIQYLGVKRGR